MILLCVYISIFMLMGCRCTEIIYRLNDTEYYKMPPVFHLDDYDQCLINPDGIYCSADIDLVSDVPSDVLIMIKKYSAYTKKHFNHTQLHHGICVTRKCNNFLQIHNETDMIEIVERCLNESISKEYQLKTKIAHLFCIDNKQEIVFDGADIALAVFLFIVMILNVVGSLYDIILTKKDNNQGIKYLLCFSVPRNYKLLMCSHSKQNTDLPEDRLKIFNGLKTLTLICVIYCHSLMIFAFEPENSHHIEQLYDNILHFIFLNGFLVVQTFFIISGCLISYNLELFKEKHKIKWNMIPVAILITWIKLTPSYMIMLAISTTWLRHAGTGPFWEITVAKEVNDCRQNGWANMLYINNYMVNSQCLVQSWYLGALMQLSIMGYIACILPTSKKYRNIVLMSLFVIGIIFPAAHTYFQDLDAVLMMRPETARVYEANPTFNYVYRNGHTNITNFVVGIALGFALYSWQKREEDFIKKYMKYRYIFLLTFPTIIGIMLIGSVFYMDHYHPSILVKSLYAAIIKPIYGIVLSILIIGAVFKMENVYRVILECNIWKIPAKLTYCAYIIHMTVIRAAVGNRVTLSTFTNFNMIQISVAFITITFILSVPFWVLLNAPLTGCLRICFSPLIQVRKNKQDFEMEEENDDVTIDISLENDQNKKNKKIDNEES